MGFDLRPYVSIDSAEGQLAEGGADRWENCTFACLGATMADYGFGDPMEPQDFRDLDNQLHPNRPPWHGGEGWDVSVEVIGARPKLYPNPPEMTIETPSDVAAALDHYGQRGFMVHWAGWCTPMADWIAHQPPDGLSHAGRVLAFDGSTFTLWNPVGGVVELSAADVAASYDGGGLLVFRRSLLPTPPTISPGGDDIMAYLTRPDGNRDLVHVGTDFIAYHRWTTGGDWTSIDTQVESYGSPFAPDDPRRLAWATATYVDAGAVLEVLAVAADFTLWQCQRNLSDGSVHNAWRPVDPDHARVLLSGPAGPKGDTGPPGAPGAVDAGQVGRAVAGQLSDALRAISQG